MDDVTEKEGAEISATESSQAEQVKRRGGGGSHAGVLGAGAPPPTAPERESPAPQGPDVPLTKRGREAAAAKLEAELEGDLANLVPDLEGDFAELEAELQEEGAELEAAGEPELTGEPGELEGDLQAGEPAEIAGELPGSPESDDQAEPGPEVSDPEVEGERPPETISLGVDTVGDLEDWAHTFRGLAGEFSQLVAILSARVGELHEAEGEDAPRPGWRDRLKERLSSSPPDQDDAP